MKILRLAGLALLLCGVRTSANDDAATAQLNNFKHPDDVSVRVFATDSQLANPIGICVAPKGRVFVAESPRQQAGVYGTASQKFWTIDDYSARSLDDRRRMFEKFQAQIPLADYTRIGERIRLLEDCDGDGRADHSSIFADGFNDMLDGAAAGVAERDGSIWFTCIPALWKLDDQDGDGKADRRQALHGDFGVRVGIHGHDMHAPIWGPDGRLYFNVGDRGFDITDLHGKRHHHPTRGGVFRCQPDGSGLELFHIGVRNPQGMAFNALGDLFTVDNDMGADDKSRILYLVEGGDSGWDATNQLTRNFRAEADRVDHGIQPPWLSEQLWQTPHPGQPAWVNAASGYLTNGPSGMDYYPGVGLPERYADHFFVCDFKGSAARSGIYAFRMQAKGAGYTLARSEQFLWQLLVSDCAFGHDGTLYISDWIAGWRGTGKGRIYAAGGGAQEPTGKPAELLYHRNLLVRQRAQFALARQGDANALVAAAQQQQNQWARLHGIRGLGQLGQATAVLPWLEDEDAAVRAEAVRVLGDLRHDCAPQLAARLSDSDGRVRLLAAIALARLRAPETKPPLQAAVRANTDRVMRSALARALAALGPSAAEGLIDDSSAEARLAAVLILRQLGDSRLTRFFSDTDMTVRNEAIRAAHDLPVQSALPSLAQLTNPELPPNMITWRIMNANFRLGMPAHASRIAALAESATARDVRIEALKMLTHWRQPSPFCRVLWHHRPLAPREDDFGDLAGPVLRRLMGDTDREIAALALKAAASLGVTADADALQSLIADTQQPAEVRLAGLDLLGNQAGISPTVIDALLADPDLEIQGRGLRLLTTVDEAAAVARTRAVLAGGEIILQRHALAALSRLDAGKALLTEQLASLRAAKAPAKLQLEILTAARAHPGLQSEIADYDRWATEEKLRKYLPTLHGGDSSRGRQIFETHAARCVRCHRARRIYGGEVGPDLRLLSNRSDRLGILESLIDPNARIVPGYGLLTLTLKDGRILSGVALAESAESVTLKIGEAAPRTISTTEIASREAALSGMPPVGDLLNMHELRDLIEFLSGQ